MALARLLAGLQRMQLRACLRDFGSIGLLGSIALLLLAPGYPVAARPTPQSGGPAFQVKDITTQADSSASSAPDQFVQIGNVVYFTARDQATGRELWKTDGTAAGTVLVKDINPGQLASNPSGLVDLNGIVFFTADDGRTNRELWKSDGTAAGTVLVRDIAPGELQGSDPYSLVNRSGTLFFFANDNDYGPALWKSDGTAAGTVLVKDMTPDGSFGFASELTDVNGVLFFASQSQLWKSDGTPDGTVPLTTELLSPIESLTAVNGTLFFVAFEGYHGKELWKSDGTVAGTSIAADLIPGAVGSEPHALFDFNGTLFFEADYHVTPGTVSRVLLRTDGVSTTRVTPDGVVIERNASAGLIELNGALFFKASEAQSGYELWKTDGTPGGTALVKDVNPGTNSAYPNNLTRVNGTLFFVAGVGDLGRQAQVWKSDGTTTGTLQVKNLGIMPLLNFPAHLTNLNGKLLFTAADGSHGRELWLSDGSTGGTALLKDLAVTISSNPANLVSMAGTLFFTVNDGTELWKSDGTAAGTVLVMGGFTSLNSLIDVNGTLFFSSGAELWKSDGTAAGTVLVKSNVSPAAPRANVNGTLFFSSGGELWKSDGTATGTILVKRFVPPAGGYFVLDEMISRNGVLFLHVIIACNCGPLTAAMPVTPAEDADKGGLWRSDGTTAGTTLVKEIFLTSLVDRGDVLFFEANGVADGKSDYEIWRSDGTPGGTVMIKSIPVRLNRLSMPPRLTNANGTLFFISYEDLWISDGTSSGTLPIKQLSFNDFCNPNRQLTPIYNMVLFTAYDPANGCELWKSDGTGAGTALVQDIAPGTVSAYPRDITNTAGRVFFAANDRQAGWELWQSKGAPADTLMLQEIAPGPVYSNPDQFTRAGEYIFFAAEDGSTGRELWAMPLDAFLTPATRIPLIGR